MKGDYPFGSIGNKLVCRCINAACQYFAKCRPDYQPAELEAVAANKKQAVEAARFEAIWHDMEQAGQSKTGIAEAANMLVIPPATEVVSMEPAEAAIDMNVLPAEESKLTGEPVAPPAEEKMLLLCSLLDQSRHVVAAEAGGASWQRKQFRLLRQCLMRIR